MTTITESLKDQYAEAVRLLDGGQFKDAYAILLSVVDLSTRQLRTVKFVHHTAVSRPEHCEVALSMIRSCLLQLEHIVVQRVPPASPGVPMAGPPALPARHVESKASSPSSTPPPLPPKPSRFQKPTVPPKPKLVPRAPPTKNTKNNRNRGNSVSFAVDNIDERTSFPDAGVSRPETTDFSAKDHGSDTDRIDHAHPVLEEDEDDDDDDDDEDDEVVVFHCNQDNAIHVVSTGLNGNKIPPAVTRPRTMTNPQTRACMVDTRPRSLTTSDTGHLDMTPIDILSDSVINPSELVPAQTSTRDSLAPPTTTTDDQVPHIPTPPLLTTHRRLQIKLDDLEEHLKELKAKKRALSQSGNGEHSRSIMAQEQELDNAILQRTESAAKSRDMLNKVRTLYMSAATIPSMMHFPPHLMAYQLTLVESAIFRDIPEDALLEHSARKPHPKITASTDFFNYLTRSIEHSILLPQEASRRAEIVNRWIKIAAKCLSLNNYQTLKAIISALGTPPIQRLERTWDYITKKRMSKLDFMNMLMSEKDNYKEYREHMRQKCKNPVVPYLGLFIYDITYSLAAKDDRHRDQLGLFRLYQCAPSYPQRPPTSYVKTSHKHSFRPTTAITNALHRTSSTKHRASTSALFGMDVDDEDKEIELQQQMIVQFLLMRPWVGEKVIDELSRLREPAKPRPGMSPSRASSIGHSSSGGGSNINSILSNASSLVRLNSNSGSTVGPVSDEQDDSLKQQRGFWPFRKSAELNRPTFSSGIEVQHDSTLSLGDEDDDDDDDDDVGDDDDDDEVHSVRQQGMMYAPQGEKPLPWRPRSSRSISSRIAKRASGHARSFSLPSQANQLAGSSSDSRTQK